MTNNVFPQNSDDNNLDIRATARDLLRVHAERFGRENYDEFNPNLIPNATLRGRQTIRPDYRRRRKSPCVQLVRSTKRNQPIEENRQGFSLSRNPSIAEMLDNRSLGSPQQSFSSMTHDSNASIPSMFGSNTSGSSQSIDTISSDSSSSGLRLLPKDPSRSSSTNTLDDVHSISTSTTSLEQDMDVDYSKNLDADMQFAVPRTKNDASTLKVSLN